ncbi:PREDICTED: mitogen-activated protein kinase kinase kinase 2-like [Camelina sativa]|uniref:Mitogen-activated protein kinase kinase kinase 2-like n=1 Tax=Camelina sativa TaxID=90675 RepID=A0ABM0TTA9_CAMSA|nr:PREDICTED: mitogen-activated protein kinase kinase kinase 2-like [Camelina sativa]
MDSKKFSDFSTLPPKNSPTKNVIVISSGSSSATMFCPLPQNPTLAVKLTPTILDGRRCSKNKKKREFKPPALKKSSSCRVIREESFDVAVQKPTDEVTLEGGLVKKSSPWVKSRLLGKGGFASVYLATYKNQERAIKTADISRATTLMNEGRILRSLQSPFVISCSGEEIVREGADYHYNLILEYCSGGSIGDLLRNIQKGLIEFDVKLIARDVLAGLRDIHARNIIHCDIKPDNLLLTPIDNHQIRFNSYVTKVGDFGLALEKGSVEYGDGSGHKRGTMRYMAPELISRGIVDFSVDIWAFGCSVLEMLTGELVWEEYGDLVYEDLVNLIGHSNVIPNIPSGLSAEAQEFLRGCFTKEPKSRWGLGALMNHPSLILDVKLPF